MLDGYNKEQLKQAVTNLAKHQVEPAALMNELTAVVRALLLEEIGKRPEDPKPEPEEKPAELETADAGDEVSLTKGRRR